MKKQLDERQKNVRQKSLAIGFIIIIVLGILGILFNGLFAQSYILIATIIIPAVTVSIAYMIFNDGYTFPGDEKTWLISEVASSLLFLVIFTYNLIESSSDIFSNGKISSSFIFLLLVITFLILFIITGYKLIGEWKANTKSKIFNPINTFLLGLLIIVSILSIIKKGRMDMIGMPFLFITGGMSFEDNPKLKIAKYIVYALSLFFIIYALLFNVFGILH